MNTISPLSYGKDPHSHRYVWTLTSLKPLNRHNKVSSPPFWIPISTVPSTSTVTVAQKDPKEHRETFSTAPEGEVPLSSSPPPSTTDIPLDSDGVGGGREVGHKMRLTLARGIVPAATEADDAVGLVLDWLPPPPLPSGTTASDIFSPPGLTTVTAFLLSPPRPPPPSSTFPVAEQMPTTSSQYVPASSASSSSSSSVALGEGKTSGVDDAIVVTSESVTVFFAEGKDLRMVLPDFIPPAQWTTTLATPSASIDPLSSPVSLRVMVEISFGGMAAATALLRPVAETVTSLWWSVSSQVSSWMGSSAVPTGVTTAPVATPPSPPTTTSHASFGDLFRRLDVHVSSVRANAEVVQERVTAALSTAAAITLPYLAGEREGGGGKERAAPPTLSSSSPPPLASPLPPSPMTSSAIRPAWVPPLPPQWADRKAYWHDLILRRLASQPATYLTTPADLSHLADRDLLDALEHFGFSVASLVSCDPGEEQVEIPDGGVLPSLAVEWEDGCPDAVERIRRQKQVAAVGEITERQRWRQLAWKSAALATCMVEDEVDVVLKVLNYDFALPRPPPSPVVALSSSRSSVLPTAAAAGTTAAHSASLAKDASVDKRSVVLSPSAVPMGGDLDASTPSTVVSPAVWEGLNGTPEASADGAVATTGDASGVEDGRTSGEGCPAPMAVAWEGKTAGTKAEAFSVAPTTKEEEEEERKHRASIGIPSHHPDASLATGAASEKRAPAEDSPFTGASTRVREGTVEGDHGGDTAPLSTVVPPSVPVMRPEEKGVPHSSATAAPCEGGEKERNDFSEKNASEKLSELEFPRMPWEEEEDE